MEVIITGINPAAINDAKLHTDCKAAVESFTGFSRRPRLENGIVIFVDDQTSAEAIDTLKSIVASHDPTRLTPEQQAEKTIIETREAAETGAKNIPAWATLTEQEALAAIQGRWDADTIDGISSLAEAKTVLGAMAGDIQRLARMVIHLRDAQWPTLRGDE